jgi:hypothetical protein
MAYRTRRGDPFSKYSVFDFALGRHGVRATADGAEIGAARDNRLEFRPLRDDFRVHVSGFDVRRDLVVRLSRDDDDAAETQLH